MRHESRFNFQVQELVSGVWGERRNCEKRMPPWRLGTQDKGTSLPNSSACCMPPTGHCLRIVGRTHAQWLKRSLCSEDVPRLVLPARRALSRGWRGERDWLEVLETLVGL